MSSASINQSDIAFDDRVNGCMSIFPCHHHYVLLTAHEQIGSSSESGGVRPVLTCPVASMLSLMTIYISPVIFQQPRPGPPLPKGESYLTIGWKQVIFFPC